MRHNQSNKDNGYGNNRPTYLYSRGQCHNYSIGNYGTICGSYNFCDDKRLQPLLGKPLDEEIQFCRFYQARAVLYLFVAVLLSHGMYRMLSLEQYHI